jgi:hypothetical protein
MKRGRSEILTQLTADVIFNRIKSMPQYLGLLPGEILSRHVL